MNLNYLIYLQLVRIHNTYESICLNCVGQISTTTVIIMVVALLIVVCCLFVFIRHKCCKQRNDGLNAEEESGCQSESEVLNELTTPSCGKVLFYAYYNHTVITQAFIILS